MTKADRRSLAASLNTLLASPTFVVFDEAYGFLPPHPANSPVKRPLVALNQAIASGLGVLLAALRPVLVPLAIGQRWTGIKRS